MHTSTSETNISLHTNPMKTSMATLSIFLPKLARSSLAVNVFLLGFNLLFILDIVIPYDYEFGNAAGSRKYYVLAYFLLSLGGLLELVSQKRRSFLAQNLTWTMIAAFSIVYMVLMGRLYNNQSLINSVTYSALPYLWMILLPALGMNKRNWEVILPFVFVHVVIAVAYVLYQSFSLEGFTRDALVEAGSRRDIGTTVLYGPMFLFCMLPAIMNWRDKAWALASILTYYLNRMFYAARLPFVLFFFLVGLFLFTSWRFRILHRHLRFISCASVAAVGFVMLFLVYDSGKIVGALETGWNGFVERSTMKGTVVDSIIENERWDEMDSVIRSIRSPVDWIFGRGFGTTFIVHWGDSEKVEERNMTHQSWLHCLMIGGIPLFYVVMRWLPFAMKKYFKSTDLFVTCCAAYMLYIFSYFPFFLQMRPTLAWIFFCLCIGGCFSRPFKVIDNIQSQRSHTDPEVPN